MECRSFAGGDGGQPEVSIRTGPIAIDEQVMLLLPPRLVARPGGTAAA